MSKLSRIVSALSALAFAFALVAGDIARSYAAVIDTKKPW